MITAQEIQQLVKTPKKRRKARPPKTTSQREYMRQYRKKHKARISVQRKKRHVATYDQVKDELNRRRRERRNAKGG